MKEALITGVTGQDTSRILEAIRILGLEKNTKFYQASTSELYGLVQEMCGEMVTEDLKVAKRHALLKEHDYDVPVSVEG